MGKVKRALCSRNPNLQVTVHWTRGRVYMGREIAAEWQNGGLRMIAKETREVMKKVWDLLKEMGCEEVSVEAGEARNY